MLKLNVNNLTEAVAGLEAYMPPENNKGVRYLYDMLYTPLANGASMRISDIDYSAFTPDDVGEFEEYFDKTIHPHGCMAYNLSNKLRELPPMACKTRFI